LFSIACLSINLIPGPDVIYIVSNTIKGKITSGLKAALGLGMGYFLHTLAACLGLSAIILSSVTAFSIIKWLGALYLLYLGIMSLTSMYQGHSKLSEINDFRQQNIFKQGVIISVLNPKVALFFLSFLPQFIEISNHSVNTQLFFLGLIFSILATLCNLIYAIMGNWLLTSSKSSRYSRILDGISGILLVGLAGKIAFGER